LVQAALGLQQKDIERQREDVRYGVTDTRAERALAIQEAAAARAAEKDIEDTPQWRAKTARAYGIDPTSPEGRAYIIGGKYAPTDATSGFEIKEVVDPNTQAKTLVRVRKVGPEGPIAGGPPTVPINPLTMGKLNEGQATAATYTDRMSQAHETINDFEKINQGTGAITGTAIEATKQLPILGQTTLPNWLSSSDRQQYDQAKRNFVNAVLRKESGAAINKDEFVNYERQYFPQPGDSDAVIAQKRANRMSAMRGMAREAGPTYRPPENILPPGTKPQASGMGSGADEVLRSARNALAQGAPRDAVIQRLRDAGVDPGAL
jgi:hypothetical protein